MKDKNEREIKDGDYIYFEGDDEVPCGEYYIDGSKWGKLLMYDVAGIKGFTLKRGTIIDNADNRNARRILGEEGVSLNVW
jgi:hypothetical protein